MLTFASGLGGWAGWRASTEQVASKVLAILCVSVSACQFSCHGDVGDRREREADVCIVYPSLAFNLQLYHLKDPDSRHHRCSKHYLMKSNRDHVFLWANFFQTSAHPTINASNYGNPLPPSSTGFEILGCLSSCA